jgi:hypothetical protein
MAGQGFKDHPENINRNGRPKKGETLTDALREIVDKDAVAQKLVEMAMERGDLAALKYIYDRIDGRPVETIQQHVTEDNPIHAMIRELVYGSAEPDTEEISEGE